MLLCMYFLKITLLREELMRNTFTVQEYMRTYQDNSGKLYILIRFKVYVDKILRFIHSILKNQCPFSADRVRERTRKTRYYQ